MEASASAPSAAHIETEPATWQPRVLWIGPRLLAGAAAFFFAAFVFAYFYLRLLDVNGSWKIGKVHAGVGWGAAVAVALVLSAAVLHLARSRPDASARLGAGAAGLAMLSVVLQVIQWTTLRFGPASGGYASVYTGWTIFYAVFTLPCAYWIETQAATIWRARRTPPRAGAEVPGAPPAGSNTLMAAGLDACSFFWNFYVAIGVLAFIVLYVV